MSGLEFTYGLENVKTRKREKIKKKDLKKYCIISSRELKPLSCRADIVPRDASLDGHLPSPLSSTEDVARFTLLKSLCNQKKTRWRAIFSLSLAKLFNSN